MLKYYEGIDFAKDFMAIFAFWIEVHCLMLMYVISFYQTLSMYVNVGAIYKLKALTLPI